jgi:TetR/AcrR family tetracycline transcriptional repressor
VPAKRDPRPPTRPRAPTAAPPLDRETVVRAALGLIDEIGLEAFTMRALAQRLATYPATVYWHVGNRGDVLSAVVEIVFDEIELADAHASPWDEWLAQLARSYRDAMHRHPNLAAFVATRSYARVTAPRMTESILTVLVRAGFRADELPAAFNAYVGSVVGWVGAELGSIDNDHGADWSANYEAQVRGLTADEFPTIATNLDQIADAVFSLRWHGGADKPLDASFELALQMWLDGLRDRLRRADP